MKDWHEIPPRYQYRASDWDGAMYYYTVEPTPGEVDWSPNGTVALFAGQVREIIKHWAETLERRPETVTTT